VDEDGLMVMKACLWGLTALEIGTSGGLVLDQKEERVNFNEGIIV
jgi:hypothetical protein